MTKYNVIRVTKRCNKLGNIKLIMKTKSIVISIKIHIINQTNNQ